MATNLLALRLTLPSTNSPYAATAGAITARNLAAFFNSIAAGVLGASTLKVGVNGVAASGYATVSSASGSVVTTINGVASTVTASGGDNATATLIVNKINAGGDTPNNLVLKHVTAARTLASATGTIEVTGTGTVGATIDGDLVTVAYATSTTNTARLLAIAINADPTVSTKVSATATGAVVTLTALNNATYGGVQGNALTLVAEGNVTVSGATLSGGTTRVTVTSALPGFAGNAVTLACTGTGLTASGARLTGGTETQETFSFA